MSSSLVGNDFSFSAAPVSTSDAVLVSIKDVSSPQSIPVTVKQGTIDELTGFVEAKSNWLLSLVPSLTFTVLIFVILALSIATIKFVGYSRDSAIDRSANAAIASATARTDKAIAGYNISVGAGQLQSRIQAIISQPVTLSVGSTTATVGPATIQSWLKITPNLTKTTYFVHVNTAAIVSSLTALAQEYVVAPRNQVSVTHTDGVTPSGVIIAGHNGTGLPNLGTITTEAKQLAKNVLGGSGLQFSTPLQSVPFQAVTPAAFGKLLEVDVTTKRMYAYDNGQIVNTFLVSAGKPSTPTPLGEFHIWDKIANQTMTGPGYVQPNVPWINYFDHSGDAVHGVYWRPASVFGNINTSHGCVGIPVSQAEWVYDWAPIGTTIIIYS